MRKGTRRQARRRSLHECPSSDFCHAERSSEIETTLYLLLINAVDIPDDIRLVDIRSGYGVGPVVPYGLDRLIAPPG